MVPEASITGNSFVFSILPTGNLCEESVVMAGFAAAQKRTVHCYLSGKMFVAGWVLTYTVIQPGMLGSTSNVR